MNLWQPLSLPQNQSENGIIMPRCTENGVSRWDIAAWQTRRLSGTSTLCLVQYRGRNVQMQGLFERMLASLWGLHYQVPPRCTITLNRSKFTSYHYRKANHLFIYLSNGQGSFSIRIPSKTSDSAYNLDMVEVLALVHPLVLWISSSLTPLVSILLMSTTASAWVMMRSIEEPNFSGWAGFLQRSHDPTWSLHSTASTHSMNIPCKERVIFTTSITFCYGKQIMPIYWTPL